MAENAEVSTDTRATVLSFTAVMYGGKPNARLNDCRYQKFLSVYGTKGHQKNLLSDLKGVDASGLPPCENVVIPHLQRAAFVARMWSNSARNEIVRLPLEENGWLLVDGELKPIWFDGDQLPESLVPGPEELSDRDADGELVISSSDEEHSSDEDD